MTHALRVLMGGARSQHALQFTIDRPRGLGCFLLLRFYVPVIVKTAAGQQQASPGDCLIFAPDFPQWYRGHQTGLCDDWLHFDGPDVPATIAACGLPLNQLFRVREHQFVPRLIEELRQEVAFKETHWESMVDLRLRELLLLGRERHSAREPATTPALAPHLANLRQIRLQIQKEFRQPWTIAAMARLSHLSPSRFFALYRLFFGVSPIEDLIRARVAWAQVLLSGASVSVKEVAQSCGFHNVYYFSRLFKKRVRCAPRDYAGRPPADGAGRSRLNDTHAR